KFGLGTTAWTENAFIKGQCTGNPSISPLVSRYMVSLRRRKARSRAVVTSARAMNKETMKKLYVFNQQVPRSDTDRTDGNGNLTWAGWHVQTMLHCLYVVSMLCLLCHDEALNIMWEDITFDKTKKGLWYVRIALLVRKTHQNGDIAPFVLYLNADKPHISMGIECYGYVFRKRHGHNRVAYAAGDGMSSDSFLGPPSDAPMRSSAIGCVLRLMPPASISLFLFVLTRS
ncbi:hypothetical protein BC835DRAFT_1426818, partial [Cytidiella melzeri]